jgi:hypothetical protein
MYLLKYDDFFLNVSLKWTVDYINTHSVLFCWKLNAIIICQTAKLKMYFPSVSVFLATMNECISEDLPTCNI